MIRRMCQSDAVSQLGFYSKTVHSTKRRWATKNYGRRPSKVWRYRCTGGPNYYMPCTNLWCKGVPFLNWRTEENQLTDCQLIAEKSVHWLKSEIKCQLGNCILKVKWWNDASLCSDVNSSRRNLIARLGFLSGFFSHKSHSETRNLDFPNLGQNL